MLAGEVVPVDALMRSSFRTESDATRGITTEQNIRGFRFSSNECCDVGLSEFEAMSVLAGPRLRAGDGVSGNNPLSLELFFPKADPALEIQKKFAHELAPGAAGKISC